MCAVGGTCAGAAPSLAVATRCEGCSRCGLVVHAPSSLWAFVAGAKLEDPEVRSVASNQSELEFSSLQDMVRPVLRLASVTELPSKASHSQSLQRDASAK